MSFWKDEWSGVFVRKVGYEVSAAMMEGARSDKLFNAQRFAKLIL